MSQKEIVEDSRAINRRYNVEDRFIEAIRCGDAKKALQHMAKLKEVCSGLRFLSDEMSNQIAGAAIVRTLIRIGAKMSGLSPVMIDSLSQDYALKMQHASSMGELDGLLTELVEKICQKIRDTQSHGYCAYVQKAIDYMYTHLEETITARELSQAAGINQQLLGKLFFQETGMTIKQYLAKLRCNAAAELLLDSRLSIQEIAARVGYADNNYFSKVFKATQGASPQDYRKKHWLSS